MKICKNCQAAQADDAKFCSYCGTSLEDAAVEEAAAVETAEEAAAVETVEEAPVQEPAAEQKKKASKGLIIGLVAVALVVVGIIVGKSWYDRSKQFGGTVGQETVQSEVPAGDVVVIDSAYHTNGYGLPSYSIHYEVAEDGTVTCLYMNESGETVNVDPASVEALMDQVVATCGDMTLTNRELQYYYEQQFYSFYSMYSSYLSYFMDTTIGLDEQLDLNGESTWQQSFLSNAVGMFHQIAALCQAGEAEGFTLSDEQQAELDSAVDLAAMAASYGYEDVAQFMADYMGPFSTEESYVNYIRANIYANYYAASLSESIELTDEEISAYYDENAETFQGSYGIDKVEKNVVNVRHILIQPESTTAEDGTSTITDEAWAAAEAEAQRIYEEWLAGEATEDSFAALATEYTQDPGSQSTGGLYEDVYPGQMVTEFNDWCFADGRLVGDHGVVKTTYGYHIMFFSGEGDYVYWEMAAESQLRSQRAAEDRDALTATYETSEDLSKAAIMDLTVPTAPAAEEEIITE